MKTISINNQFKRDLKKNYLLLATAEWAEVLNLLVQNKNLPKKYQDHSLTGNWVGFRDCHIKPDLVLIYKSTDTEIILTRLGSHSELF